VSRQPCNFTPERAALVWWITWQTTLKDTSVAPFIGQGFNVQVGGNTMRVDFDSVMGRGGARRAMLTISQKLQDSSDWQHWRYLDSASQKLRPDTSYIISPQESYSYWKLSRVTTVVPTSDSTFRDSRWFQPYDAINYDLAAWAIDDSTHVQIMFVKVLGDPTRHYGWDQRALLKVRAFANVPPDLDSLLSRTR
jgi:hypothetical protein